MNHAADAAYDAPPPLPEFTDELIDAALERARRAVCGPLEERCYAFSSGVDIARKDCTRGWAWSPGPARCRPQE
jgi:hypothetical protein